MAFKRRMTENQAGRCETAKHPRCRCRCGGRLHGISHSIYCELESTAIQNGEALTTERVNTMVDQARIQSEKVGMVPQLTLSGT